MRGIKQNLFWAFIYNIIGIPLAAGILYPFTGWLLSPVFDIGQGNLRSPEFVRACRDLAEGLGLGEAFQAAFEEGLAAQEEFDRANLESGRRALAFCEERGIVPVVVLGRPYTIHNDVLNSNVPSILRSQGAIAIPVDSYPVDDDVPIFHDMFWAQGQRILRAAHQIQLAALHHGAWSVAAADLGRLGVFSHGEAEAILRLALEDLSSLGLRQARGLRQLRR